MKRSFLFSASLRLCGLIVLTTLAAAAQSVPAPRDVIGFTPGDDRKLASWTQIVDYFKKLDKASNRMTFQEIGKTTMGAPFVYATISSPENLKTIKQYEQINAKLADPRLIKSSDTAAKALIKQGKTIVLITCGVHSTEVGSTLSSMLIAHRLTSSNDPEIQIILKNTIILLVPSLNPDGVDIVKNWYDKTLGTAFEGTEPPELYHKYVGHDNNRDWYAFTQVETQLTVDKIHNVWHPQIVHDIHQQGQNGSRLFLPPYMQPVEPNVPKQIVEGYTELGNAMAADLRSKGFEGITTNTTYDAWTPARAYSHYHGGVRILSETASARIASPITVKFEDLRGASGGLDAKKESPNFSPVWKGGEWKLRNITDYMTGAAFSLLNQAANNREKWLSRFYEIGKEAVRPRKEGELRGFVVVPKGKYAEDEVATYDSGDDPGFMDLVATLARARVESKLVSDKSFPQNSVFVPINQPYGAFAKSLLEKQSYPNLIDEKGSPIVPYDVTAHTLPLLFGVDVRPVIKTVVHSDYPDRGMNVDSKPMDFKVADPKTNYVDREGPAIFRSTIPSMDEGWTRWVLEKADGWIGMPFTHPSERYETIDPAKIKNDHFVFPSTAGCRTFHDGNRECAKNFKTQVVIFPDQPANQILTGYAKGSMPDEYVGGVGQDGVANLKKFVEDGGTLVFLNESSNFAIEQFGLPVKNVTRGLPRKDFYIPGSILRTELDLTHPMARGMPKQSIAWFENSPAFEITPGSAGSVPPAVAGGVFVAAPKAPPATAGGTDTIRVIARYPTDPKNVLLSGWALGAERIAGKAALVEITMGKGKIVLFGFRPQYRGQSLATFPLLFNAISQ